MEQLRIQNTDTEDTLTREQREDARDYEAARTALLGAASETRTRAETVLDRNCLLEPSMRRNSGM